MNAETSLWVRRLDSGGYTVVLDDKAWECADQEELLALLRKIIADSGEHGGQQ